MNYGNWILLVILILSFNVFAQNGVKLISTEVLMTNVPKKGGSTWFQKNGRLCGAAAAKDKPYLEAVKRGNSRLIESFLQKGASPNFRDDCDIPVITYAAHLLRPDLLKMFARSGADVNAVDGFYHKPPLLWVLPGSDDDWANAAAYKAMEILIAAGADVNLPDQYGDSALIKAVQSGEEKAVGLLLAARADINFKGGEERTAYSYAATEGFENLKDLLALAGADIRIGVDEYKREYKENAFFQAAADGRTDVVEAMLIDGQDVNAVNEGKMTALMRSHEKSTVDSLLKAGADVNLHDKAGFTALIWAAAFRDNGIVLKLIAAGADVNAKTLDGKTAMDFVNNEQLRDALINAGAKEK